jgi:ring-1,2-phenylacetyl-CoA epoxidase subunit PaaC
LQSGTLDYTLHLADSALVLSQRNAEWCGHGPVLEQDIAITNISLDLIGQARNFYQYAASLSGKTHTEDTLAYLRTEREFKNFLLVEQPNGDWAQTILRQFFFSNYQFLLYDKLKFSSNTNIASIAAKALKEVTYHLRWSSEWVIRLGDGTEESHRRTKHAVDALWSFTGELFIPAAYENSIITDLIAVDPATLKETWLARVSEVFAEANLTVPEDGWMQQGGKNGVHTEHLGYLLAELQYLQRVYPGATW